MEPHRPEKSCQTKTRSEQHKNKERKRRRSCLVQSSGYASQKSCRQNKKDWIKRKCTEAQEAERKNDTRALYGIVREITNDRRIISVPIKSKDGKLLLTEEEQNNRWKEHFKLILNQPEPTLDLNLNIDEEVIQELEVNMSGITIEETKQAIRSLKNNKAPGMDDISTELLKHGEKVGAKYLTDICDDAWQKAGVPEDWTKIV
jgi:hypothetical protein